jgi:hypothetical protein
MLRIFANINKQDVIFSWTVGQNILEVNGKIIRIEASSAELLKLSASIR